MTEQSSDHTPSEEAGINYSPSVPKGQPGVFVTAVNAAADTCRYLLRYLDTGSVDDLTKAANAMLVQSTMRTRSEFSWMLSCMTRGENPLTDAQREEAKEALRRGNA